VSATSLSISDSVDRDSALPYIITINTAKSSKTRIYVITYLIINKILTKVTKFLFCMFQLQPLATYLTLFQHLSALRFPALLNIIDTGMTGIAIARRKSRASPLRIPLYPLLICQAQPLSLSMYTGSLAIPDRKRWILAVRYTGTPGYNEPCSSEKLAIVKRLAGLFQHTRIPPWL